MFLYKAFGLFISSEIALPDCPKTLHNLIPPDLKITIGKISHTIPTEAITFNHHAYFLPGKLWLHVKDVAWFYISSGKFIIVEPYPNADPQTIQLYLLGSGIGAIMHQRNTLIIHGNAICIGNECVIFTGDSGAGKSTIAAALYQKGHAFLADDLSVVDPDGRAQPGIPRLKLWQDTVEKLDIDTTTLSRIRLQVNKYSYPIHSNICKTPLPVKAIYALKKHSKSTFLLEEKKGGAKLRLLQQNTYRNAYIKGLSLTTQRFKLCSKLANQTSVFTITRPADGFNLEKLIEIIEKNTIA